LLDCRGRRFRIASAGNCHPTAPALAWHVSNRLITHHLAIATSMKAEYINPFMTSLTNAFDTMLSCPVQRGKLTLKSAATPQFEVSGVIGLSGNAVGTVVLSLSRDVAMKATSVMLMTEANELNSDVVDAVGELTNMVAGAAKAELEEYKLSISLPNVVLGKGHEIRFPSNVTPICVPFSCEWGELAIEVGLAPAPEPAAV
jgi:chemotaxis protein CheX